MRWEWPEEKAVQTEQVFVLFFLLSALPISRQSSLPLCFKYGKSVFMHTAAQHQRADYRAISSSTASMFFSPALFTYSHLSSLIYQFSRVEENGAGEKSHQHIQNSSMCLDSWNSFTEEKKK